MSEALFLAQTSFQSCLIKIAIFQIREFGHLGLHYSVSITFICSHRPVLSFIFNLFMFAFSCSVDDPEAPQSGHLLRLHRQRRIRKDSEEEGRGVPCGRPLLRAERGTDRDLRRLHHWRQQVSYPLSSGESLYRFLGITHTHTHTHTHSHMPHWTLELTVLSLAVLLLSCRAPYLFI